MAAVLDAVATLEAGYELQASPQDPHLMNYFHLPGPELFDEFARLGMKLYDLDEYAADMKLFFGRPLGELGSPDLR